MRVFAARLPVVEVQATISSTRRARHAQQKSSRSSAGRAALFCGFLAAVSLALPAQAASPGCAAINSTYAGPVSLMQAQAGPLIPAAQFLQGDQITFTVTPVSGSGYLQLNDSFNGAPFNPAFFAPNTHNPGGTQVYNINPSGPYAFQVVNGAPSAGAPSTLSYTLSCTPSTLTLVFVLPESPVSPGTNYALPTAEVGRPYSQQITAMGSGSSVGPYAFSLQLTPTFALPPGLTLSSSGLISGTPLATAGGNGYLQIVRATDQINNAWWGEQRYSIDVAPALAASTSGETDASCFGGNDGSISAQPGGGVGPYTYSWSPSGGSGATASGLASGSYTVTITDALGATATASGFVGQASAITFATAPLTGGTFANSYSATLAPASGGTPGYTYAVTGGALPAGVGLAPNGQFSGTPTAVGPANFTVTATDSHACPKSAGFSIAIGPETINVTAQPLGKVFGSGDPLLTFLNSPSLFGVDLFSGALSRAPGENAGNYAILQGSLALNANYTLNFTGATFTISKADQTLTFSAPPTLAVNGTGSVSANSAPPNSGAAITVSTASTDCSVTPAGLVTAINAGSNNCVITASQAGSSNFNAGTATQTLSIGLAAQTLTFSAPPTLVVNGTGSVSATSATPNSGATVTYSTSSTDCTVTAAGVVTAINAGNNNCVISAGQAGNGNYSAGSATQTLSIGKAAQTLTFAAPPTLAVNGTASVSASSAAPNSGAAITYSTISTDCSVTAAGVVTAINAGSNNCVISASQAGDGNYNAGAATQTLSIAKALQTLTFGAPPTVLVADTGSVTATSAAPNSGNAIVFSTTSTDCTVSASGLVTGLNYGTNNCVVTASQTGDGNYLVGTATQSLSIGKEASTVTLTSSSNPSGQGSWVTFTASVSVAPVPGSFAPGHGAAAASTVAAALAATPGGSVSFSDGATVLGTIALTNGSASFPAAFATPGNHTITAAYSGDAATAPASATIVQAVGAAGPIVPAPLPEWLLALLGALVGCAAWMRVRRT